MTDDLTLKRLGLDPDMLVRLVEWRMPFGRYRGVLLIDLPEPYLQWWAQREFPKGELGRLMELATVIKGEGLGTILDPLRRAPRGGADETPPIRS